jgi:hypothetical protein
MCCSWPKKCLSRQDYRQIPMFTWTQRQCKILLQYSITFWTSSVICAVCSSVTGTSVLWSLVTLNYPWLIWITLSVNLP